MSFKNYLIKSLAALSMLLFSYAAFAQTMTVKGTVLETDGKTPVLGCGVIIKGTTTGVMTETDGTYSIKAKAGDVLQFQCLGYEPQEITVRNAAVINVTLKLSAEQLEGVVVTALGLTREEKSLGYAVSKVDSKAITQTASSNWLNGMNGKVAGLTFQSASSGPIGSLRVTLRGDQSLNYGSNEALFIVDGIPINSGMTAVSGSSYTSASAPVDFGNGASDINPDDIESVSVLKGPAATALYGSRAANGAIVITTKKGRAEKGVGVTFNSSVIVERAGYWPDFQTEYGSGSDSGLEQYCFWTLDQSQTGSSTNPTRNLSRYAWGEKFDASQFRYQYASKDWTTGEFKALPWVYADDWYSGIFRNGVTFNNQIEVSGSNGKGTNVRFAATDTRNNWILPNTGYTKETISFSFTSPINKYIDFNAKVNYYKTDSGNMPAAGYDETTVMYDLVWGYNTNPMSCWKDEYFNKRWTAENRNSTISADGKSLVVAGTGSYNPYRNLYENINTSNKDHLVGQVGFTVHFTPHLTLTAKTGLDQKLEFRTKRFPKLTADYENGYYGEQTLNAYELNSDFLLKYDNSWFDDRFTFSAAFGGNNMTYQYKRADITLSELDVDGVYNVNNVASGTYATPYGYRSNKTVNSLYGLVSLGWNDTFYLDLTGRNDWSSTLSPGYWSYFYPSVAGSILLNKLFNFQENIPWITFSKLRVSWANVGNDTSAYSLDSYYGNSSISGGFTLPGNIPNPNIRPENVASWEVGLENKFFNNRLGFDVAAYYSSTTDQIVDVDVDQISGATSTTINAGEITNKGLEVSFHIVPVRTKNFEWDIDGNWARNINKLVSLQDGWDNTTPLQTDMGTTIGGRLYVYSYVGQEMHQLYGYATKKAPEGSYYLDASGNKIDCSGKTIIDSTTGLPTLVANQYLGKVNPDWRGGFSTSFRYKNLSLACQFTYQWGGHRYSVTDAILGYQGKLKNSLEGRYDGIVPDGVNVVGTDENGNSICQVNNTLTSDIYTYYQSYALYRYNMEAHTYDTSFLKLKEARLDYALPEKLMAKTKVIQGISFGIFATNLFCWSKWPQFDPEGGVMQSGQVFEGIESGAFPMTRTYGFNLKVKF
jgi:TonB-linked SusC/RagA family outer membrane protein